MKLRALIHSCSNEHVARAALNSIGGEFAVRVAADFERTSDLRVWAAAEHVMHSSEQPILAGLYFILDHCLAHARSSDRWDNHVRVARRGNEGPLGNVLQLSFSNSERC